MLCRLLAAFLLTISFANSFHVGAQERTPISIAIGHENKALVQIISDFTTQTGYPIQTRIFDNADLKVELLKRSNTQELPDVAIVPSDFLGLSYLNFSPISPSLLSPHTKQIFTDAAKLYGRYLGIPFIAGNHLLLYYNKTKVKKAITDWQQLITLKNQQTRPSTIITWSYNEMYWLIPFMTAFNAQPLLNDTIQIDTPNMQQALRFYLEQAQKGVVDAQCDYQCSINLFENNQSDYLISGIWSYNQLKTAMGPNLGVSALPAINGVNMQSYFSAHVIAFLGNSLGSDKRAVLESLANYLQSENVQRQLWTKLNVLPVNSKVIEQIQNTADENTLQIFKQLNQSIPMPNSFTMAIVWEALSIGFKRYFAEINDVQQSTELMQHLAETSANAKTKPLN